MERLPNHFRSTTPPVCGLVSGSLGIGVSTGSVPLGADSVPFGADSVPFGLVLSDWFHPGIRSNFVLLLT